MSILIIVGLVFYICFLIRNFRGRLGLEFWNHEKQCWDLDINSRKKYND